MKTTFYTACILTAMLSVCNKSNAQNANTTLSNLVSPTKVNVNLQPGIDGKHNLGGPGKAWRDLYLDSAIYIQGHRFITAGAGISAENTAVGTDALNANTTGAANTAVGYNAMFFNTTGYNNTATGLNALYKNTTGLSNTAMGIYSMSSNTSGGSNAAFGTEALYSNTTASYNTAIGTFSLFSNTADGNTALGYAALNNNTTGFNNVAIGMGALQNNTVGGNLVAIGNYALHNQKVNPGSFYSNTAVGSGALYSNTTGDNNTANGSQALYFNTTGEYNTAIGSQALYFNTTGYHNIAIGAYTLSANTSGVWNTAVGTVALNYNSTGSDNTATGHGALFDNTTGSDNTATGMQALTFNSTGDDNTASGSQALGLNTTGFQNTAAGFDAGYNMKDGSYNSFIGSQANCGSGGHLSNGMALGYAATVTSNNHVVVGNSSVTSIGGYVNWSNLSDGRVKKNIKQNIPGLEFINKLLPITYNLDLDAADKIIALPERKNKDGKIIQPSQTELDARKAKEQIVYTGFVAQDVEKAAQSLNYDFSGVDKPDNANTLYGLRYSDFVVPLVKAVQELSAKNNDLQKQIDELKQMILASHSTPVPLNAGVNSQQSTAISYATLSQNIPNPFSNSTTINYSIPQQYSSAIIILTDKNGNTLKQINLSNASPTGGSWKRAVTIDASTLASGAYQYSLIVDGRLIDSKQMVSAK